MARTQVLVRAAIALLSIYCVAQIEVESGGAIYVRLEEFVNEAGKLPNGNCCDGQGSSYLCQENGCDHQFIVCLDNTISGDANKNPACIYGKQETNSIENQNSIVFTNNVGGVENPMMFYFPGAVPTTFTLNVLVWDYDPITSNDFVDSLDTAITVNPDTVATGGEEQIELNHRTRLTIGMQVSCDDAYYGADCDTYCRTPVSSDHYKCDPTTGEKICNDAYYGADCDSYCRTPAPSDHYKCDPTAGGKICDEAYYGDNCDVHCQTLISSNHYNCDPTTGQKICDEAYYGTDCDTYCRTPVSSDHYKCDSITGEKICDDAFYGTSCDAYCRSPVASDHYKCDPSTGGKICDEAYYGAACDVYCQDPVSSDHYTCNTSTGQKICDEGWTGSSCDENEGKCIVDAEGEHCTCHAKDSQGDSCLADKSKLLCPGSQCYLEYVCPEGYNAEVTHSEMGHRSCSEVGTTTTTTTTTATTTTTTTTEMPSTWPDVEEKINADCDSYAKHGYRYQDGVYEIEVGAAQRRLSVYCDMSSEGWTVILNRAEGDLEFNRNWEDYKEGFGRVENIHSEYWIGLESLYQLTNQRNYELSIVMQLGNREFRFAHYKHFWVDSEEDNYRLHVDSFSGSAGDALQFRGDGTLHDGMDFSTYDRDNDKWEDGNCALNYISGWWFNDCYKANLFGAYKYQTNGWPRCVRGKCVSWQTIPNYEDYSLVKVKMQVLPNPR